MSNEMIKIEDGIIKITTPYNKDFVNKMHGVTRAKWNRLENCWEAPEETINDVRGILKDVYGYSDIDSNETIKVKLTIIEESYHEERCADVTAFGKILAHAYGRDSGAEIGRDDVTLVKGSIESGGSVKNWTTRVAEGSVFTLYNVNKNIFEKDINRVKEWAEVEIIEGMNNREKLLEEKEKLLKRIAEIDALIANK